MADVTVAVLGGGRMGEALIAGLQRSGEVVVSEPDAERAAHLESRYGVRVLPAADAVSAAATVLVAVKPHHVDEVLAAIAPVIDPERHLVVSVAAGVPTGRIEAALPDGTAVVRCMPNTPALLGEGMTALAAGSHVTDERMDAALDLLRSVGRVARVPEQQLDAVTALSGSGPAYFFHLAESMIDAGVLLGLPRPLATELVVQTARGSAAMLSESGDAPAALREAVTSPGGTTAAALRELDRHAVRSAIASAAEAAAARSAELGAR